MCFPCSACDCRKCSPTHARTHARTNTQTHVLMSSFLVLLQKTLAMQVSPGGAIRNRGECNRLLLCASPLTTAGYTFIWSAINHTRKGRGGDSNTSATVYSPRPRVLSHHLHYTVTTFLISSSWLHIGVQAGWGLLWWDGKGRGYCPQTMIKPTKEKCFLCD